MLAWTAIRWKDQPEGFRGRHLRVLGPVLVVLGAVVLCAGLVKGDSVAAELSWVCLAYGFAMVHYVRSHSPLHPRW